GCLAAAEDLRLADPADVEVLRLGVEAHREPVVAAQRAWCRDDLLPGAARREAPPAVDELDPLRQRPGSSEEALDRDRLRHERVADRIRLSRRRLLRRALRHGTLVDPDQR